MDVQEIQVPSLHAFMHTHTHTHTHTHILLKVKISSLQSVPACSSSQSCSTLFDPMGCSTPGSSVHGIFQARVLEWGAIAFSNLVGWYSASHELNSLLSRQDD